jgi:ParB family chromosome partitioning protein
MTRKALGRGLGALIPGAPAPHGPLDGEDVPIERAATIAPPWPGSGDGSLGAPQEPAPAAMPATGTKDGVIDIPLERIDPNPKQPRLEFDGEALDELAESIRIQGVLQPVLVRPAGDRFQLVAGERRLRASKKLGRDTIPAIVRPIADDELLEVALIENLQREDLNAIEEALGYQRLLDELHYTHDRLSERVGKNRSSITNTLRLLSLPASVQAMVSRETLTAGHARALLGLASHAEIDATARYVADMGLSVRKTEALVARKLRRKSTPRRARGSASEMQGAVDAVSSTYAEWTNALRRRLATQVRIVPAGTGDRGQVEIEYYSETDLERVLELLGVME